jgi:hypothetical protein
MLPVHLVNLPGMRLFRHLIPSSRTQVEKEQVVRKRPPGYISKQQVLAFGSVIVAALLAIYTLQKHSQSIRAGWPSVPVSLSEFRTTLVQVYEGERGSAALYQGQADVRYTVDGLEYNLWLPILPRSEDQRVLQSELNGLRKSSCYVHWNPAQPKNAFLTCKNSP